MFSIGYKYADLVLVFGHRFGQRRFKFSDVEKIVGDDEHASFLIESLRAANMLIVAHGEEDTTISLNRFLTWRFRR